MCVFLLYWAGLQSEQDSGILMEDADRLQSMATQVHDMTRRATTLRIGKGGEVADDDPAN